MTRRRLRHAVALLAIALMAGCTTDASRDLTRDDIAIASGNPGGVFEVYATSIGDALRANLEDVDSTTVHTDGSVENIMLVSAGKADLAFSLSDTVQLAATGRPPFDRRQDLVAVARLYDNFLHVIVRDDSEVESVADLAGGTVSIGSVGSGTAVTALNMLKAAGQRPGRDLSVSNMDLREGLDALGRGAISAVIWSGGLPTSAVLDANEDYGIRLVDLGQTAEELANLDPYVYTVASIPVSTYPRAKATTTVSVPNLLVARADVDPDLCYQVVRAMFEHAGSMADRHPEARRLNLNAAIDTYPLDLCQGSIDYLRSVKE